MSFTLQNTITNTEKLLVAADELAQTGECDPQEIFNEARQLEERMNGFLLRIERQRHLLDLSVCFFTHTKEVSARAAWPDYYIMFTLADYAGTHI